MLLAIDIGFHRRDMTRDEIGTAETQTARPWGPRCLINRLWRVSDRPKKVSQAHEAGETHQGTKCNTPARLMETTFHENSEW